MNSCVFQDDNKKVSFMSAIDSEILAKFVPLIVGTLESRSNIYTNTMGVYSYNPFGIPCKNNISAHTNIKNNIKMLPLFYEYKKLCSDIWEPTVVDIDVHIVNIDDNIIAIQNLVSAIREHNKHVIDIYITVKTGHSEISYGIVIVGLCVTT